MRWQEVAYKKQAIVQCLAQTITGQTPSYQMPASYFWRRMSVPDDTQGCDKGEGGAAAEGGRGTVECGKVVITRLNLGQTVKLANRKLLFTRSRGSQ